MHRPINFFAALLIACFVGAIADNNDDLVLTDGAMNAAQYVGVQIVNELVSTVRGFKATRKFHQAGLDGTVTLSDVNAQLTQVPDVTGQLKSASELQLELDNLGINMDGKFDGNAGWFSMSGNVHGEMKQMKIILKSSIERAADGTVAVKLEKCRTVVGDTKFTIDAQGMLGSLAKNFEGPLNKEIAVKLPHMMCLGLKEIVEKRGPKLFGRLLSAPLEQAFKRTAKAEAFIKKLKQ